MNKIGKYNHTTLLLFALIGNERGVRLLLRSGAKVITTVCKRYVTLKPRIRLLLWAAGQRMIRRMIPRHLKLRKDTLYLHCRAAVRRHLLNLDPHENLFLRVPRLGLPSLLAKNLLFNTSLEENYDEVN